MRADAAQRKLTQELRAAKIETADLDARVLLCVALECDATALARAPEQMLTPAQAAQLNEWLSARLAHKPVSRILGRREFYGRDFIITDRVLDPRADSETLIEAALARLPVHQPVHKPSRILDLGTGSGCLVLTLLAERVEAQGVGADVSPEALAVAQENAAQLGVGGRADFIESDWFREIDARFDMIVSNPPYLAPGEMEWLDKDVADYDPHLALYGGSDGLDPYRLICRQAAAFLKPQAWLIFEIGALQARAVTGFMQAAGFEAVEVMKDLAGRDRVVCGRASAAMHTAGKN